MWCVLRSRLTQVLWATLCALPSLASAQPEQRQYVALDYQVAPGSKGCPSEDEFRARVSSRLGYDPHRPGAAPKVSVVTRPTAAGLEGVIRWTLRSDSAGPRVFDAPTRDCAPLSATMAFVLAVQIQLMADDAEEPASGAPNALGADPNGSAATNAAASGDVAAQAAPGSDIKAEAAVPALPEPAEPRVNPPASQHPSPGEPRAEDALVLSLGAGPTFAVGLAPDPVLQGRLFAAAQLGAAALELAVEARPTQTATFAGGGGFRHRQWLGSLAACLQHGPLALCAVPKLGALAVSGVGVDRPMSAQGLLVQIGPRVAYLLPLSEHFGLLGHLDASYLLSPWVVRLDGAAIWSVPRLSAVAGIDLALHFR